MPLPGDRTASDVFVGDDRSWSAEDGNAADSFLPSDDPRPEQDSTDQERLTRFIAGIARKFSDFYAVVGERTNLLLSKLGEDPDDRREIEEIREAAEKAAALARRMVAFATAQVLALERERFLANVDPLTGVLNAKAFRSRARDEIDRSRRYGRPFTLAFSDLDNFKEVNDRFGHSAGDNLLRMVTDIVRKNLRTTDIFARVGGDEFVLLLPETEAEAARAVLGKIQNKLRRSLRDAGLPVTLSVGAVIYLSPPDSVDAMIHEADTLMYQAKHSGKNRIRLEVHGG